MERIFDLGLARTEKPVSNDRLLSSMLYKPQYSVFRE